MQIQGRHASHDFTGAAAPGELEACGPLLAPIIAALKTHAASADHPWLSLARETRDLAAIEQLASELRTRFDHLLVLGTGGSSLGARALAALKQNPFACARVHFVESTDPVTLGHVLSTLPLRKTAVLAVSKSGGTVETLTQFMLVLEALEGQVGKDAAGRQCFAVTIPEMSPLRRLAEARGVRVIDHDPKLGGRFSVFSEVGLLPAAVAGLDIRAVRAGAAQTLAECFDAEEPAHSAPALGAASHFLLAKKGFSITVWLAYADRLADFGLWLRQGWAESLGKQGMGTTLVRAMGPVDQHSQLQLYLDGPKDKYFTFLTVKSTGENTIIPEDLATLAGLPHLAGKKAGDVQAALAHGTRETLLRHHCPLRTIALPVLDEAALGALLMHSMLEIVLTAGLMGVNAFDQPAVEESKQLARDYLQRIVSVAA